MGLAANIARRGTVGSVPALLVCGLAALAATMAMGQGPPLDDPLPLQRVVIPLSRLPAELERVRQGVLVQMPREEFEALVQRAARSGDPAKGAARLIKAAYTAQLVNNSLVQGGGQWTIHRSGSASNVLPMPTFNLAVDKVHWAGGGNAVLGALDGKSLGLFVEKSGEVFFDWSLRGNPSAGGTSFQLQLPPCPVGVLELKVPANQAVVVAKDAVLLSGPDKTEDRDTRLWRLQFSGRSQVEFQVRNASEASPSLPLVLSQVQVKQKITPAQVIVDFDFQVEIAHTSVQELVFDCEPSLQPFEVSIRNGDLKNWDFLQATQPALGPGRKAEALPKPASLTVRLRDSFQGVLQGVKIRCLAPRPTDKPWVSPGMQLRLARMRSEALKIEIHPDVQLDSWDAAGFRLVASTTDSDGSQVLALVDPSAGLEPAPRPVCLFKSRGFELLARQHAWWQIGPKGSVLTTDIVYESARGSVFQLAVKLPPPSEHWRVEAVTVEPGEALRSWVVAGQLLMVDLARALNPRSPLTLSIRLSTRQEQSTLSPHSLAIPSLEPLDAVLRQGVLAVTVDPLFQVALQQLSVPLGPPEKAGPWAASVPQYFFPYRDKAVTGRVRLFPQKARVRVRCQEEVVLTKGRGSLSARLELEPVLGNPTSLDFMVASPREAFLDWQVETGFVRSLERQGLPEALPSLLFLGARSPLERALLQKQIPEVQHWRLQFARPLTGRETVVLRATLEPLQAVNPSALLCAGRLPILPTPVPVLIRDALFQALSVLPFSFEERWDIPLPVVSSADRQDAELMLQPSGVEPVELTARGLDELTTSAGPKRATPRDVFRVFRFGPSLQGALPRLAVTTQVHPDAVSTREWCDQAHLVTYVESGTALLHHFRFHAWNWRKRELVVLLPPGTQKVLAAKVDGRWLEQVAQEENAAGWQVMLPAAMDLQGHRFDLYYQTEATWSGWPTGANLDAPLPQLPVPSPSVRRTWRLAADLVPLHQETLQPLTDMAALSADFRRLWHFGDAALGEVLPVYGDDTFLLQRQVLLGAESGLRRKLKSMRFISLGDAFDRLAHEYLKDQLPLVLDRAALRAADLRPESSLTGVVAAADGTGRPFWDSLGLVYVPFRSGPVLTTRQQYEAWQQLFGRDEDIRHACEPAIREAIQRGHDVTGRFVTLAQWLRTEKKMEPTPAGFFIPAGEGWTTWEPRAGHIETSQLRVFQSSSVRSLGLVCALFMTACAWRLRRLLSSVWCVRLWIGWLTGLGIILIWLPAALQQVLWWPLLVAAAWSACWFVHFLMRQGVKPARTGKTTEIAKVLVGSTTAWLLCMACAPAGRTEGPDRSTVLLVERAPGKQLALVTQELLKALGDLDRGESRPAGAVLVGAHYQGRTKGSLAEFSVDFDIHCFSEKAKLLLPLTGVELQEGSYLDGAPVFPVAPPSPKSGYVVPVLGKGPHRLRLSFTVRTNTSGDFQELRFSVPKLCTSLFEWTMAGPAQGLHLVNSLGEEKVTKAANALELKGNLGRLGAVQLRWRVKAPVIAGPTPAEVREAYFWDLHTGAATLSAALQYTPVKGPLAELALSLPDGVEVRSVQVTAGKAVMAAPPVSLLKKWHVTGKGADRRLHVVLTGPVAQRVHLSLSLVPRLSLAAGNVLLRLPAPVQVKSAESFLAYRLEGWDVVDKTQNLGVTSIGADAFAKVWAGSGQNDPGAASRAYSFRRTGNDAGLGLTLTIPRPKVQGEIIWTLSPQYADFSAHFQFATTGEDVALVEMNVPVGVTLADVRGPAVHHWSRHNTRVQIWLQQPRKLVNLELHGWMPLTSKVAPSAPGRFNLPALQVQNCHLENLQIKVQPGQGTGVEAERVRFLTKGPELNTYLAENSFYEGTFLVRLLPVRAEVRMLTTVEMREKSCLLVSHFHCQSPRGDPGPLQIVLRNCPDAEVSLDAELPLVRSAHRRQGDDYSWDLTFPPGSPQPYSFRLRARIAPRDLSKLMMPDVAAQNVDLIERWVAVSGAELRPDNDQGLVPVQNALRELSLWPGEAQRIQKQGKAWRVQDAEWSMHLGVRSAAATPAVQVMLAEERVYLADGQRWIHQADFLLATHGETDVPLALPAGARLLGLTLDDQPVAVRPAGASHYWVPVGGPLGAHVVRARWRFEPGAETLTQPNLGGAHFVGVPAPVLQGCLLAPAGFSSVSMANAGPSSQIEQFLTRARARLQLARVLSTPASGDLAPGLLMAEKGFFWNLHLADLQISYLDSLEEKNKVSAVLDELRKANERLLQDKSLTALLSQAEKRAADFGIGATPLFAVPEQGRPIFWQLEGAGRMVTVALADQAGPTHVLMRRWSEFVLIAALALFFLSYVSRGAGTVAYFWPELCMLGAVLAMFAWDISLMGVCLVLVGLTGRLVWGLRSLRLLMVSLFRPA